MFFITPLVFYAWATTFTITKNTVGEIILLVITALWVIKLAEGGNYPSLKFPLSLPIIFFSAALLISLFQTHTYYTSFLDLARWSSYILLYFIITSCLREKKWMKGLLIAILSASLIASSYAIFQFYGIDFPFWRRLSGRTRLFSTFGNPNYLSGHLAACLPLAFAFFCLSKKRLLSGIPILVLYAGVLITNIGGCIALFGGGIFILLTLLIYEKNFLKRNRSSLLYLILALIIVTAIYSTHNPLNPKEKNVVAEGASYTSFEYGSTQQRFLIWLSTYQMIKEHPFLGSGVGTFRIHYPSAQGKVLSREKNRRYISQANKSINAHNDYLHIWAETGIIGLIFFIWIIAVFYKKTFFYLKKAKKEEKFFLIGFAGGGVAILIHALFSFPFHIIQNGLLFFAFLSLSTLIGEKRIEEKENKEKEKREGKRFILPRRAIQVSAVLLAILLGTLRVKLFIADTHIKTAEMMMKEKAYPLAVSELIKALKIDNDNGLAFANLGENYGHLRLYTKSFYALKKAEINWIYPHLYNNLGCSYIGMKKWVKAEEMFKKNIFLFPNSPNAYFNLGSLFLLKAKKNILHENIELAKKNLDKAFTSYEQGRVFKPDFSLPSELREAYSKVGEENSEGKTLSSFSFFTPESSPFLDILIPPMKCGEEEYLRLFFYLPPKKNYTSISKINIEIKDEGRLIENFTLKKKISPFYNIISIPYKAPAKGRYRVIVRVRYGRGKVILAKKNFSLGG